MVLLKEIKVGKLIQFISFFPTVSSGPIDRYKRFVKDDKNTNWRAIQRYGS